MGKVHGSLARAGKVRGQTPKVAKQDKKKQPRGRAHKRIQYNRRFVTAVVGFGKKRGPNSSENCTASDDDFFVVNQATPAKEKEAEAEAVAVAEFRWFESAEE
ncbi:Ribosomal protein S30 [Cynara cardunculus var. scolymus]|uniref:Ribosomal protein S30 n=1 Tax=Cynara cardunculus var. scolymus TaxID=59895 RepID=A0A118JSB0_CYNCS|nr:Ribosomal protein S30 [Cynara cardunculus var. scolymus]